MPKSWRFPLALALVPCMALAAEKKEERPLFEEKIEVVGKVEKRKVVQSVTIFSAAELRNLTAEGLKRALMRTPGMLVLNSGHAGQFAYSFARGAAVNQMLYLVDGFKLADPSSSLGANFVILPPALFEKVEIVRGPLSHLYGSSAMGGAVNLVTRSLPGVDLTAGFGSFGSYDASCFAGRKWERFQVGFAGCAAKNSAGAVNDDYRNNAFSLRARFDNGKTTAGLTLLGDFIRSGIPLYMGASSPNREYSQDNLLLALPVTFRPSPRTTLEVRGSANRHVYRFSDPDDPWNPEYGNRGQSGELGIRLVSGPVRRVEFQTGAEVTFDQVSNDSGEQLLLQDERRTVFSAYSSLGFAGDAFHLLAAARLDGYQGFAPVFSPQLGGAWFPLSCLKVRGSLARSFRAPTLPERFNPYWGNRLLNPEIGESAEVGCDVTLSGLETGIVYFTSRYRDLIGFSPLSGRFANISRADVHGLEASVAAKPRPGLRLFAAYTYLRSRDRQYDRALLRRPKHTLSASFSSLGRRFTLGGEMVLVGARLDYDEMLWTVGRSPAFSTFAFDFSLPLGKGCDGFARVSNAFDSRYQEVLGYPAPPRRIMAGIRFATRREKN